MRKVFDGIVGLFVVAAAGMLVALFLRHQSPLRVRIPDQTPIVVEDWAEHIGPRLNSKAVTIVVYTDYFCVYCRALHSDLLVLEEDFGLQLNLVFRHFPNESLHPGATEAAIAVVCLAQDVHFRDVQEELYRVAAQASDIDYAALTRTLDVDQQGFSECQESDSARQKVERDLENAKRLGVDATPTLLVEKYLFRGQVSLRQLREVVRGLL